MFHYFFLEQIFAKPIKDVGGKKLKDWRNSPANILSLVSRRNARGVVFNQLASAERDPHNGKDKKDSRMGGRVLSGIEAIEPRIIRTGEQKAAIFERGIGERNYIL